MRTQKLVEKRIARRKKSIRSKISGTPERLRLSIFKSNSEIYAQLIDDTNAKTIVAASSIDKDTRTKISKDMNKTAISKIVGATIAERAIAQNIKKVVFDRNGNLYTGRVKALADAAREAGLEF
ncbi:MAG: 50S ribosomal protein L18 [Ignavibacteria bacterium]|jgi:large subunit ribosomal protein L18|nr:50S ribosomal protein L18 [Ignavibacteria bacterium]